MLYLYRKTEKKEEKKKNRPLCRVLKPIHSAKWPSTGQHDSTLPSAKTLALGKVSNVCQVLESSTRQRGHVAPPWAGTLPSARRRHSAKFECPPLGTRQSVGLEWRHVAALPSARNPTLGTEFAECKLAFAECNRHSAKPVNPVVGAALHLTVVTTDPFAKVVWSYLAMELVGNPFHNPSHACHSHIALPHGKRYDFLFCGAHWPWLQQRSHGEVDLSHCLPQLSTRVDRALANPSSGQTSTHFDTSLK